MKYYIWSIALYGADTWTLQEIYKKCLARSEMWSWRRMEKISWIGRVKNEVLHIIKGKKYNLVGHILRRSCLLKRVKERKIEERRRRKRRHEQLLVTLRKIEYAGI